MKRSLLLLAVTGFMATAVFAQKEGKGAGTPAAVKAAFEKSFPGVSKVKWEKENKDYEVNFMQGDKKMAAVYDSKGVLKETELVIKVTELPAAVAAYVQQHYKGAAIKEAEKITKADGTVQYEAAVKGKTLVFDANGKFLEEEKD